MASDLTTSLVNTGLTSLEGRIANYLYRANRDLAASERHPDVFNLRAAEFITLLEYLPERRFGIVADVGCGNGFMSALWSLVAKEVIGVDEAAEHLEQHSIGLQHPQKLIEHLGVTGVSFREGRIEELPFDDG